MDLKKQTMARRIIPLFKVHHPKGIGKKIEEIFQKGIITEGEISDKFEQSFAKYIGNPNCTLTNSCTAAITLALRLAGVKAGDEVISTPMTCMATNEPIDTAGARIVWADVDPTTGNIDPRDVEKKLSLHPKVKAIIAVHWAGQPFNISSINKIAKKHKVKVIEDAAHALDSTYKGKKIGCHSDFVCFSFQAIKHLTTGDGGALFCKKKSDDSRAKLLKWFGLNRKFKGSKWKQDIKESGYKFHMNNITATIGLEQLKYIKTLTDAHRNNASYYDKHLNTPKIEKLNRDPNSSSSCWIYSLLCEDRDALQKYLQQNGIQSDVVHVRNDQYSVFKDYRLPLEGISYFNPRLLNIPVGWWIKESDAKHIVETINKYK
jgi:dTDP-4-amino-4,6-dideoxygalactose transaminase